MKNQASTAIRTEQERDDVVRNHAVCPVCHMPAGQKCHYGVKRDGRALAWSHTSHESRYNVAADAGLVPKLPGTR